MMKTNRHQHGFTLIEMMITVAVLTLVMGTVVAYISRLQRVYKTQETSVDSTDESRMFLDNIERELHQSGYPSKNMYTKGLLLLTPPENNTVVAYGLVSISKWNIYFEGDFDNDGVVEDIRYTLLDSNGAIATGASTCPCTLQRTLKTKIAGAPGTTITDADVLNANLATAALNNVINSGDGAGNALTITGTTGFAGGSTSNNVLYASYKTPMIFTGYDNAGNVSTNVAQIRSIEIAVNLLTNYSDTQTNMRPPLTMRTTVKLNNF
jgi:prepilin-type N-terminal cleavage/methylation domain-containing protein